MTFYPEPQIINLSGHPVESHPMTNIRHLIIDITLLFILKKLPTPWSGKLLTDDEIFKKIS